MKSLFLLCLGLLSACSGRHAATIEQSLRERAHPVLIASGFHFESKKLRTVYLYGLNQSASARLAARGERVLVYTSDARFAQHVGYHFSDLKDPSAYVGWTMFATLQSGTVLDLLQFDASGRLVSEQKLVIDVAYFEEGTELNPVRIRPKEKKPNKAPEPTPRPVTDRAGARSAPGRVVAHL